MTTLNAMLLTDAPDASALAPRLCDRYLRLLAFVLLGYVLMGKGFAYFGFPPLFIGEITLCLGVLAALTASHRTVISQLSVAWPLLLFMAWGAFRTIPFIDVHGMDALRDGVTWGYGVFALVVMILIAERRERLLDLVRMYRAMIPLMLIVGPILTLAQRRLGDNLPQLPWSEVPIIHIKGGDFLVHVTGVFGYLAVVGGGSSGMLARAPWLGSLLIPVSLTLNLAGRAGVVSFAFGAALVALFRPFSRPAIRLALIVLVGLLGLWVTDFEMELTHDAPRNLSFEQLRDNLLSIVSDSDRTELSGSKSWRLEWWTDIVNYTFNGPYFWTGKGYGINLASADGYQVSEEESLRSPHNGHMTMLARGGVPGLFFWGLVQGVWLVSVLRAHIASRRAGQSQWAGLFAFIIIYWAALMANTAFDVFIEGPMGGIWLWVVYGVGLAAVEARRSSPHLLSNDRNHNALDSRWRKPRFPDPGLPAPATKEVSGSAPSEVAH